MPRTARPASIAAIGFALAVPIVAALAYYVRPLRLADAHALHRFSAYGDTAAGTLAEIITFFAEPVPLLAIVALGCAYALWRGRPADVAAALVIVAGANLTTQALKHLFAHERFEDFLTNPPDLTTFPSGHVTGAATLVVALTWLAAPRSRRVVACGGAAYIVLVGFSVLVLEWHFPSDVVGALCVSGAWTCAILAVYAHLTSRRPHSGDRRRAPTPPGTARAALPAE